MIGYLCGSLTSCELLASDEAREASEFLSALNASLESFDHKTLKDEQIQLCFHRIVCHGRYVLAVLPTGFGKSAIYQLIPKCCFTRHIKNHRCFLLAYKEKRYLYQVTRYTHKDSISYCSASETYSFTNETGGRVLQNKPYFAR